MTVRPWFMGEGALRRVSVVIRKELLDHLRDRRSLVLALVYPMLGPLLVAVSLFVAGNVLSGEREPGTMRIPTIGIEYAPNFVAFLAENGIEAVPARGDLGAMVRQGGAPLGFEIPPDAGSGDRFLLRVYADYSKIKNLQASSQVGQVIAQFNRQEAGRLAREAGLREDFLITVAIDQVNLSRPADIAVFLYNLTPPLIMFMIFLAGVHITVDMTAGERERGSLEPLLITPIERPGLLFGKAVVGFLMTALAMAINVAGFRILLGIAAAAHPQVSAPPSFATFAAIFMVGLPLMALAVAFQMAIALVARSMKEAQIYLGLLPLIPALPGMVLVFSPLKPTDAVAAVPLLGQLTIFNQLVAGEPVAGHQIIMSAGISLILAALIFWYAQRLFEREKLLFVS